MENQTNTDTGTNGASEEAKAGRAGKLGALLKTRFAGVKAQLDASQARAVEKAKETIEKSKLGSVQGKVKGALQTAVTRVKNGLDLPSRSEVTSLAQRIEELDKKINEYETRTAAGKGKKKDQGEKTDWA